MAITHIASTPDTVRWGTLPLPGDRPVATVESDDILRIDTVSHEGLLEDQGRDPLAFFHAQGVRDEDVLADAIDIAERVEHPQGSGPHVITRPIAVKDVHPGDWLAIDVLSLKPRVPYGVISNRHGKGVLMGGLPRGRKTVSIFARAMEYQGRLQGVMRRSGTDAIETFRSGRTLRLPDPADGDIVFPCRRGISEAISTSIFWLKAHACICRYSLKVPACMSAIPISPKATAKWL